jgi:EAL domain-containing protein (putative c-di-GMP-specific phosphodiesterase class I)
VWKPKSSPIGLASSIPTPDLGRAGTATLVFQPAVDLATGRLLGFEALLRWRDSSGDDIPPNVLIPWAESHGKMNELNAWVLSEACVQATRWPRDLQLAVNCSTFQLHRGIAAMAAATAIEQSGLNPDRLTVEVTESSVADNEAARDMHVMTRLGIQLTVDDVVAESSVLEDLPDCNVNTVKLDASLIASLTHPDGKSRSIVEGIVTVSRSLGVSTVAEAVETAEQVTVLRDIGVEAALGYFFSPPHTGDEAGELARMSPPPRFALSAPAP